MATKKKKGYRVKQVTKTVQGICRRPIASQLLKMLRILKKYTTSNGPRFIPQPLFNGSTPPAPFTQSVQSSLSRKPFLEIGIIISLGALSYFAIDNYNERMKLESKLNNQVIKSQQMQKVYLKQMNAQRKKRELQILNERKSGLQRQMKMALHIAMLRKQLVDLDQEPVSIETIQQEYTKSIKMENSISNVSGTALWITDDSTYKAYLPNAREYDVSIDDFRKG